MVINDHGNQVISANKSVLHLRLNSPDINGDGTLNLTAAGFIGTYCP